MIMRYSSIIFPALKYMMSIRREIKKRGHFKGIRSEEEAQKMFCMAALQTAKDKRSLQAVMTEIELVGSLMNGRYRNYFIETEELFQFLSTTEVRDPSHFFSLCKDQATDEAMMGIDITSPAVFTGNKIVRFTGAVHAPCLTRSIMFSQVIRLEDGSGAPNLYLNDGDEWAVLRHDVQHECPLRRFYPLILNMFLYIDCFPDSIREGVPSNCFQEHGPIHGSRSVSISTHDSLIERSGPSPHLRRGHFRYLASERFTKKRGQTVFVHASFVKGHAETVEDVGPKRVEMLSE